MASTPTRKTARTSRQGDESRERILDAAAAVAAEHGLRGATIEKVSKACGLPPTSLYWHFGDKDRMLAAVIRRSYERCHEALPKWDVPVDMEHEPDLVRERIGKAIASIASESDLWRLGILLMLEQETGSSEARKTFLAIREDVLAELEDFWKRLFRSSGVSRPALAKRLACLMMASTDGLFIAARGHDDWNMPAMARLISDALDGVVRCEIESPSTAAKTGRNERRH